MADDDTDTQQDQDGTQDADAPADDADANADASTAGADEVSLLRSRYAGQTAKVTSLTKSVQERDAKIAALQKERDDALAGLTSKDEALKAQIAAKEKELADERAARRKEVLQAQYPETFGVLGEAALSLGDDQLAANEARLASAASEGEPPTPRRTNAPRTTSAPAAPQTPEEEYAALLADLRAREPDDSWVRPLTG